MKFDTISNTWKVNIRANLQNQDSEIEKFIDWLAPHICTFGFIGYTRYEEFYDPTLIYIEVSVIDVLIQLVKGKYYAWRFIKKRNTACRG